MTMANQGFRTYRFADNPEEERFAKAWALSCKQGKTLAHLLNRGDMRCPMEPSDHDQEVAATIIQWLGSPVGQGFLRDLGYERKGAK